MVKSKRDLLIVNRLKTLWEAAPDEVKHYWERGYFSLTYLNLRKTWSLSQASENTQICSIRVFRLSLFSCNIDDQLSQNVHRFVIYCICLDTPSEERITPLLHKVLCFQMLDFETSKSNSEISKSNSWKITSFSKTTLLHYVLYYQQLPITCYQVRFYANYQ